MGYYYDRLQFMTRDDALGSYEALGDGDVSHAWSIWSSAAEAALADAHQFSGGPVPDWGLVLGASQGGGYPGVAELVEGGSPCSSV